MPNEAPGTEAAPEQLLADIEASLADLRAGRVVDAWESHRAFAARVEAALRQLGEERVLAPPEPGQETEE